MNLVQQANFLEDVPKEQLVSMSQDPNAQFPAFLVLSEIQRRTTNEKNYQAMVNQPTTTVAEEVVSDFAQPTGLQGGAPQATPLPTNISAGLSGAPTAPMQMAASGGVTGYATGDMTALPAGSAPMMGAGMGMDALGANIDLERLAEIRNQVGDQAFKFMFGEKFGDEFMDYVAITPGIGVAGKVLTKAPGLISKGYKGLRNYFRGPKKNPSGRVTSAEAYGGEGYKYIAPIVENPLTSAVIATPVLGAINQAVGDSEASDVVSDENKKELTAEQLRIQELEKQIKELNDLKGLGGAKETESRGDYRDLVRLGAGIMSAKNIGDIGTAVTGVLDAQDKRGLVGLQGKLTKAQTLKLEADIASMDKNSILARMTNLTKALEAGLITDIEAAQVQYSALAAKLAELEGQETKPASEDANVIASYG
jgi:hypothetical protein